MPLPGGLSTPVTFILFVTTAHPRKTNRNGCWVTTSTFYTLHEREPLTKNGGQPTKIQVGLRSPHAVLPYNLKKVFPEVVIFMLTTSELKGEEEMAN